MTPKEKAKELVEKFEYIDTVDGQCISSGYITHNSAIECAVIAVDEILNSNPTWFIDQMRSTHKYWEEVKTELIKIKS